MPNYQLVATSMFEPYSYERYLAPFGAYSEAYKELEDALADLLVKANIWEDMANKLTDPRTYAQYKKYADDLQTQIDTIASQGLTPTSRRDMLALKKRYSSEITPIELGYAQRAELQKSQRDMLAKDPSLIFERDLLNDPQAASLDNFVGNSAYDYGRTYSGSKLMSDVSKAAENLSKTLNSKTKSGEELRAELKRVLPYQYRLLELKGFDVNDILNAIGNEPNANGILTGLIENVIDASGMRLWASEDKLNQARAYAAQGLWSAIGETSDKWLTDTYGMQGALKDGSGETPAAPEAPIYNYPVVPGSIELEGNFKRQTTAFNTLFAQNPTTGERTFDKKYLGPNENINPLRIYDYYEQWVDTHPEYRPQAPRNIINVRDAASAERLRQMMQDLVDKRDAQFQKETGINPKNIISKEQYDALLEAGFNQNTPVEAFINSSYDDILEGSITVHRPSSLNLANYDGPRFRRIISQLMLDSYKNNESIVRDFDTGKPIKPKRMGLTEDSKILDVQYSNQHPDEIILQIGDKRYAIKMSFIDPGTVSWILNMLGKEALTTDDYGVQSEIQNVGAHTVRSWSEDFNKVPSTSTSKTE